jgi:bifunctional DNA-binding transcriptional regulator/antitoxin component of YhaV-PrlF toxin-antitoxin module
VPAEVRRKLGLGPGSVLAWEEDGDRVIVRRAGAYSSEAMHAALFPTAVPLRASLAELKAGIGRAVKKHNARR